MNTVDFYGKLLLPIFILLLSFISPIIFRLQAPIDSNIFISCSGPFLDDDKQWDNNIFSIPLDSVTDLKAYENAMEDSRLMLEDFGLENGNVLTLTEKNLFHVSVSARLPRLPDGTTDVGEFSRLRLVMKISSKPNFPNDQTKAIFNTSVSNIASDEQFFNLQRYNLPSIEIQSDFTLQMKDVFVFCGQSYLSLSIEDNLNLLTDFEKSDNFIATDILLKCPGDVLAISKFSVLKSRNLDGGIPIVLNPLRMTKLEIQTSIQNVGELLHFQTEAGDFIQIQIKDNWIGYDYKTISQHFGDWNVFDEIEFIILLDIQVSKNLCESTSAEETDAGLIEFPMQVAITPHKSFGVSHGIVDQLLYNNVKQIQIHIDCNGLGDLQLFPPLLLSMPDDLSDESFGETIDLNIDTDVKFRLFVTYIPLFRNESCSENETVSCQSDAFHKFIDNIEILVTIHFMYDGYESAKPKYIMEFNEMNFSWTYEHVNLNGSTNGFEFIKKLVFEEELALEICSQTSVGSLQFTANIMKDGIYEEVSFGNNVQSIGDISLINCPIGTRIHFDRVDFGITDILHLPQPKTTVTLSMLGFTTNNIAQDITAEVNFYLCPKPLTNSPFESVPIFQTTLRQEKCVMIDTLVTSKQVHNNQARFDSVEKLLEEILLDSTHFPFCWKFASMVASVWNVESKEQVIYGKNILQHAIFVDCGSREMNECYMEVHNCTSPSVCVDEYGGFSCVCPDEMVVDQYGNCSSTAACSFSTNGICVVNCLPGFSYHWGECVDFDECMEEHSCPSHSSCLNSQGSFSCECDTGFILIDRTCVDNMNCTENSCPGGICEELTPGIQCFCNESEIGLCENVNNVFGSWSNFSECSATCGAGVHIRHRSCLGNNCVGVTEEEIECIVSECPYGSMNPCSDSLDRCDQLSGNGRCVFTSSNNIRCICKLPYVEMHDAEGNFLYCSDESKRNNSDYFRMQSKNDEESLQGKEKAVPLHPIENCKAATAIHVTLPYAVPFNYRDQHLFLRHLYASANGIFTMSSRELQLDWVRVFDSPSAARQFPTDLEAIFLPLWTLKANYTDYSFTSICSENILPESVKYSKTQEYVHDLLRQSKTMPVKYFLQFTIITWRGHITDPESANAKEDFEFQAILASDFDFTFLIYIYGKLGSGLELVSRSFPILKGYAVNDPRSLTKRYKMTDVTVDGFVEQEFLPHNLHGQYGVYKVAANAGQGARMHVRSILASP